MKLKRTFKTLLMIIATVMSVVSGILIDSGTLAYAATTYTLTLNWDDGVEWVATDRNGTDRWEKGGSKTFQAGSKAYTYVKLRNGATVKSFFSRQENYEWTDYTYISGDLCYDTWTMYGSRNVDIYTSVSSSADVSYDWDNLVTSSKHYHSSNGNEASWSNLRDDLGRSPAPVYSIYYKLQENRYRETCYGDNQEDKDFGGYEIMLRTEDSHNSYWYGQSSYANGDRFDDWYRDEFEGIKLSNLAIVPVQIKGDKFLQINISVKNTNSYAKEISLATCSDIQVADDDNATTFFNGNGFTMTNMYCETSDNYSFGTIPTATLNVYAKDVPGYVTDADAVYIGHFIYRKEHVWLNNVLGDKTTYFNKKPHGGTSGEGELDSSFSIAWKNRTIAAGQTQTYSYIIGIGKYNSDNKITFDANGGKLKTPGENINKPNGNNSNKVTVTYGTASYSSMSGDIPERTGYTFDGWWTTPNDSNASVMVYDASGKCNNNCNYWKNNQWQGTNDLTVYAHWKAADVGYTVNHYVMDTNGNYPSTPTKTERLSGFMDTSVTPNRLSLGDGFTYPDVQTVKIKADGTTVVKYYYTRNKYTLDLNGLINGTLRGNLVDVVKNPITGAEDRHTAGTAVVTVNGTVVGNKVTDYCNEVYYGSSISIITTAESGYSIIDNSNVNFKMPAEGKTVTVTINAKDTKYLVRHWKKNVNTDSKTYNENSLNDSNYTMYDAEYLSGKAYSRVKPVVRTLEGFTYKGVLPSEGTAYVKPDGTTVIDVYYTRNTYTINGGNVNANVEYGNGISSVSGLKTYEYEQKVTLTANLKVGYHWHGTDKCASSGKYLTGWYSRNNSGVDGILTDNTTYNSQTIKFNMPARNVYLGVKATNNSYTVVYNKNQPVEPNSISNVTGSTESQTFIYDESQNLRNNGFTLTGYTRKSGWMTKPSKNGNGTADFSYGQSVKNLTTVNLGTVNLYAIWEDNAPEEINISSTNDFAATQTVTLTARDYGSGIDYISFGKDEKYEKVTCNADGSVTFTRKVNASGTYIFSVKDKNGKVSKKTITFYQTTLNTNKNNIVSSDGKNVIESDFTSVPETLSTYISINEAGKSITPVTKRDGVDFLGWSTDRKGKTGIISIKADGNKTCYAIWKDTKKPVAVLEDVTSNLSASQTITFKLYDTAEGKTNTGSDIAGYYIGTNPDAESNTKKNVTADKNGTYSGSETITLNGETTYYIFPYDKAGNIGDTIKLKSTGNNNTPEITPGILFHRVDFNANGSTDSPATVNIPYAVIPHGSTITMPTAYRLGYHDYTGSDEQTADNDGRTSYWGTDSKAVTGFNTLKVTKSQTCFALWKANKYTITLVSNKPDTKNGYRVNSTYSPENDTKITVTFDEVIPFSKAKNPAITGWTFKGYAFNELSTSDNNNSKTVVSTNQKFGLQFVKDWYKDAGKTFENVSDITLYAAWSENRYTVNYNTTGGTALKLNRITYWYEDEFSLPDATGDYYNTFMKLEDNKKAVTTYRPAHHFVMWKCVSDENSNGDVYSSGGKAVRLVSKNNGECTLNAVWKQKQIVTLNITSDTFKESMTNDYAALADAMWAKKGTGYIKDQTAIKEYTFTKTSDIKETK